MDTKGNSIRAKGMVIGILNVVTVDRDLICPHEINFRKDGARGQVVSVVPYVWEWDRSGTVQRSEISTRPPTGLSWARGGGRMTKIPRHVGLYRSATCSRTQPWLQPSGQEQGDVGAGY